MAKPRKAIVALSVCVLGIIYSAMASQRVDPTLARLAKVSVFAFGGVGFSSTISDGEKDFRTIAARTSAEADLEKVLAIGTPEAKCYALTGLLRLDPGKFEALTLSPAFTKSSAAKVTTIQGCLMSGQTLHDVVESIRAGIYSR